MVSIDARHPEIAKLLIKGNFVVYKTERNFSGMRIDQVYEQNNAVIKGEGGESAPPRMNQPSENGWLLGQKSAAWFRITKLYTEKKNLCASRKHQEETGSIQIKFLSKVKSLCKAIEEMGNPIEEESANHLTPDTKDIASCNRQRTV